MKKNKNIFTVFVVLNLIFCPLIAQSPSDSVYQVVDKVPVLKAKRGNVQKALNKSVQYPISDFVSEVEGTVNVSFIVSKTGQVSEVSVVDGLTESLNKEAVRAISSLGEWKPGKLNNKVVNTLMEIPVHFKLTDDQKILVKQLKPVYSNGKTPLFVLDNQKVLGLSELEYYNVKSIRVIKGAKAINLYGDDAADGVVVIETKRGTNPQYQMY